MVIHVPVVPGLLSLVAADQEGNASITDTEKGITFPFQKYKAPQSVHSVHICAVANEAGGMYLHGYLIGVCGVI